MKTTDSIGRRSFLRGTMLAVAAGALPLAAAAATVTGLPALISRHREALAHRNRCMGIVCDLDEHPDHPEYPSVQVGRMYETHEPIFVHSEEQIVRHAPPALFWGSSASVSNSVGEQKRAEWIAAKVAIFRDAQDTYQAGLAAIGYTAAEKRYAVACEAEENARLALVLHRAVTDEEARLRSGYIASCEAFIEQWCEESSFRGKLYAALGIAEAVA